MTTQKQDVIVIGAGAAGLAAARVLAESGRSVLVIEARDRVGGRICTRMDGVEPIELGPEFVHGRPPVAWWLIEEAKLATYELNGEHLCAGEHGLRPCGEEFGRAFEHLEELESWQQADISFAAWLAQSGIPPDEREMLTGYVEGFNAADQNVIGVAGLGWQQKAADKIDGDRLFRIRSGYAALPEFLAQKMKDAGGSILLETVVERVNWQRGAVEIVARNGGEELRLRASQCIVTLPLAVLQRGAVAFTPAPKEIFAAADLLRMGYVRRLTLTFRSAFWKTLPGAGRMGFLHGQGRPRTWWTQFPEPKTYIVGWSGGPGADAFAGRSEQELGELGCATLAADLQVDAALVREELLRCHSHDWQADPFALGAYSYVPAGAMDALAALIQPQEKTLFFAGEHTDPEGHWGTVHGAISSGLRAAAQVLETG